MDIGRTKAFFVYILASKPHDVIYVGMSSDLPGRAREHREVQRSGPGGHGERVLYLAGGGELRLELAHLRAHREHPALEHLGNLRELALAEVRPA